MLPDHFQGVTDDISQLVNSNWPNVLQALPKIKEQTMNIKEQTLSNSITRCQKIIAIILDDPESFLTRWSERHHHDHEGWRVA